MIPLIPIVIFVALLVGTNSLEFKPSGAKGQKDKSLYWKDEILKPKRIK